MSKDPHPDDVDKIIREKFAAAEKAMKSGNHEKAKDLMDEANAALPPKYRVKRPPPPEPRWKKDMR